MSLARLLLRRAARVIGWPIRRRLARFEHDCLNPQAVQERLLFDILRRQAGTGFGRDHHFSVARTVADFRRTVPVAPYEYVEPYVERLKNGDTNALIAADRVLLFALTSGTTAARKLIPVTTRYLA
ncbi:MAG: GH3 family domain-containing protein, partial [Fimbriiglobus sp.]